MREPRSVVVGFSGEQLERLGVPSDMTDSELADCVDEALLEDDGALRMVIEEWIEDHADDV